MTNKQLIPSPLLKTLKSTYEHFPDQDPSSEHPNQFDAGLEEFLKAYGTDISLESGEILFLEGDNADGLYWIEDGVLGILQGDLKEPRVITFRKKGHVVGEIALLENIQRTASVVSVTQTDLKYLASDKFQGLLSFIPGFGVDLMRLLSARLREIKPAEYSAGLYDHLTGTLSRKAFDFRFVDEIERAQRYRYNFSIVFLDLDRFKDVNDNYGHARGDEVLIAFTKRIMSDLRTTDLLFRYGGDEFVLLLQGIDETRGPGLVQHLLDRMTASPLPGDPPVTIGFSAGISYFPADGETAEDLLKAADERVYHSKRDGRGRVTSE